MEAELRKSEIKSKEMLKRNIARHYAAVTGLTADWPTSRKIKVLMLIHIHWFDSLGGVCLKLCQLPGKLDILTQDLSKQIPIALNPFFLTMAAFRNSTNTV